MYVIKMCDDKSLRVTSNPRIFMGENRADDILFLLPEQYGNIDIGKCSINMSAELPDSVLLTVALNRMEGALSDQYLMYGVSITGALTSCAGKVKICLHITDDQNNILMKTGTISVRVERSADGSDPEVQDEYIVPGGGEPGQVLIKTMSGVGWNDPKAVPDIFMENMKIEKIAPYLYHANCSGYRYEDGDEYYAKYKPVLGACSAVSNGNFFGRNYDWTYDERLSFVLHTPATHGRYATLGVAAAPSSITREIAESGEYANDYKVLPFLLLDGINSHGLICETNVVPSGDYGITTGTNPDGEDLFALMIPRYVLDYAASVDEAITLLRSRNIFCAYGDDMKEEFHFMLSDGTKTTVVEFVNNVMYTIDSFVYNKPIITNFYLYGYDGTRQTLTPYAMGIERYAVLADWYGTTTSVNDMMSVMRKALYTKAYSRETTPFWYSEFCGDWTEQGWGNLTKDTPTSQYEPLVDKYIEIFNGRQRDGKTWQTVHTSVYDIEHRELIIAPQEGGNQYRFRMDFPGVVYGSSSISHTTP